MYAVTVPLNATKYERSEVDKRFACINKMHNLIVSRAKKLLNMMNTNHRYRDWLNEYRTLNKVNKLSSEKEARKTELADLMNTYREAIGLTEYGLQEYVKVWQGRHPHIISSQQAQKEATRVWKGAETVIFKKGKQLHYRKLRDMRTVGGKSNKNGVRFDPVTMTIEWLGMVISCKIDPKNMYLREALHLDNPSSLNISYCEISRKSFNDGWHYYVIVFVKGTAPDKNRKTGTSTMGIDPGVSSAAGVSETDIVLEELAPNTMSYNKKIAKLQRQMDESKRATNPENFNEDGTVKPKTQRKPWKFSTHYFKLQGELRTLFRKKSAYIEQDHNILANRLLEDSCDFIVEKNNFAAMAKKSKKPAERQEKAAVITKKDGTKKTVHKFKRKKRLGKSMNDRAPSKFLSILKRKAEARGGSYREIKTQQFKATQYCHDTGQYIKIPRSQRWKTIAGHKVQRDLYSAFLIRHSVRDGTHPNRRACKKDFADFCNRHDIKIAEMKANNISMKQCFGF